MKNKSKGLKVPSDNILVPYLSFKATAAVPRMSRKDLKHAGTFFHFEMSFAEEYTEHSKEPSHQE